jgi:hypothetical protein
MIASAPAHNPRLLPTVFAAFACLLLLAVAPTNRAKAEPVGDPERWGERVEWIGSVAADGTVRVNNPYGDVRARFGGWSDQVEVLGNVQHLHPSGAKLEIRVEPFTGGLDVTIGYPEGISTAAQDSSRADLAVLIPHGIDLEVSTKSGTVDCKGLHGDVNASTHTGDITVRKLKGAVSADSDRGNILLVLEPDVTTVEQVVQTRTGDISLHLPASADMIVEAATSGAITTDFSITIAHRDRSEPNKIATATIGTGAQQLSIRSLQGAVRIMRRPPLQPHSSLRGEGAPE